MLLQPQGPMPCSRLCARTRRRLLQVQAAKKGDSPWSTGGPKRGSGGGGGSSSSGSGSGKGAKGGKGSSGGGFSSSSSSSSGSKPGAGRGPSGKPAAKPANKPAQQPAKAGGSSSSSSPKAVVAPPVTFTDPLTVTLLDELSKPGVAATPKWDTFCNHMNGEWIGQYGAYTPWEGLPEPAWMDARGRYVDLVYTRALELRPQLRAGPQQQALAGGTSTERQQAEAEEDVFLRKIGRSTTLAGLLDLKLTPPQRGAPAAAQGAASSGAASDEDEDGFDLEALAYNSDGVVVFDGGSYSAGPEFIGRQLLDDDEGDDMSDGDDDAPSTSGRPSSLMAAKRAKAARGAAAKGSRLGRGGQGSSTGGSGAGDEEDARVQEMVDSLIGDVSLEGGDDFGGGDGAPASGSSTVVMEQCLVEWGTKVRMRVKLTLRIGHLENGEADVEVLRMLLCREQWAGPADMRQRARLDGGALQALRVMQQPCNQLPRPQPAQLQGSWNVFTVCATGVDEVDPLAGTERVVWVYTSNEERQLWDAPVQGPPGGDLGGAFWLPNNVLVTLKMVDNYVPAGQLDGNEGGSASGSGSSSSNGNGSGSGAAAAVPRGLCVGLTWLWQADAAVQVEREYDGYGHLRELRCSSAVKGGWSGGRM